jgi:hypothetical protein
MDQPIEMHDPADIHPLPDVRHLPRWDRQSPEFFGFREDVRLNGIKDPLRITRQKCVVDGELRRQAAISLKIAKVPCILVPDDEVDSTFVRGLVFRRNLTKGQRAYLTVPKLKAVLEQSEARRLKNLRNSQQISEAHSVCFGNTLEQFAAALGFGTTLLDQAIWLHKAFAKDAALRTEWEPKILDLEDPIGLGAAKAGIAGEDADQSQRALGVLQNAFSGFMKQRELWNTLDKMERAQLADHWQKQVETLPDSMRKAMKEVL